MNNSKNIILTGIPRSGTSLACKLLSKLDNVLALQEPMQVETFHKLDGFSEIKQLIDNFFQEMRISAVNHGEVISRFIIKNEWPDNYFPPPNNPDRLRKGIKNRGFIPIKKKVTMEATLIIKHPVVFTALLSNLVLHYPVFTIIRNPIWVLASWDSADIKVRDGHAPMAEIHDKKLATTLNSIEDRIDRQIFLLSWMFERYSILDSNHIIYYEDMIDNPSKVLSALVPNARILVEHLKTNNLASRYPNAKLDILKERLLKRGGAFFDYYSHKDL